MRVSTSGCDQRGERGGTIIEAMAVLALSGALMAITASYSISWIGREELRQSAGEVRTQLQATRAHAINRNRACRFQLNTTLRRIQIYDLVDPSNNADDILLTTATLPDSTAFTRPDTGSAVTLPVLSGTTYQATFESNGSISSSPGLVCMGGGTKYNRVTLYAAGGVKMERWMNATWTNGS